MKISDVKGYYHAMLISFRPEVDEKTREEVYTFGQTVGDGCGGLDAGILHWTLAHNLDIRKGVQLVEFAVFKDEEAFKRFKDHPIHQKFLDLIKPTTDWKIGDFLI